jgi:hypothetical protein
MGMCVLYQRVLAVGINWQREAVDAWVPGSWHALLTGGTLSPNAMAALSSFNPLALSCTSVYPIKVCGGAPPPPSSSHLLPSSPPFGKLYVCALHVCVQLMLDHVSLPVVRLYATVGFGHPNVSPRCPCVAPADGTFRGGRRHVLPRLRHRKPGLCRFLPLVRSEGSPQCLAQLRCRSQQACHPVKYLTTVSASPLGYTTPCVCNSIDFGSMTVQGTSGMWIMFQGSFNASTVHCSTAA